MEKTQQSSTQSSRKQASRSSKANTSKNTSKKSSQTIAAIIAVIAGVALIALYFIMANEADSEVSSDQPEEEIIETNCNVIECITKIETSDSVEKITEVIGVEPDTDETTGTSKWKLNSKESIAREKSGSSYILQATINKEEIAQNSLDFSVFTELKESLENGETFSYDELVKKLDDIEGVLAGKTDTSKRYIWVNKQGQTLSATFSNKDGKCSIISLR